MYDCRIRFPWNDGNLTVTVRAEGFKNPDMESGTDDRAYHGVKIKVPKPEQLYERTFEITFRMDASYNLYGQFVTWLGGVADVASGGVANWAPLMGEVHITSLAGGYSAINEPSLTREDDSIPDDSSSNAQWHYTNVWVSKVSQPEFKTEDASVLKYSVTFNFYDASVPFGGGFGVQGR
jgi:hypothetical protein